MTEKITRRLIITGRVQGVGFRAFVMQEAKKLGVAGFVRNRNDGSVEAVVSGRASTVEALIAHCRKGPAASQVERVVAEETTPPSDFTFLQLPTV